MTLAATPVQRLPGWESRLDALIRERATHPFRWGVNDCCLWAADAVLATTGHDPAAGYRGTYATRRAAAAVLRRIGGLLAVTRLARGRVLDSALLATAGDVGLVTDSRGMNALGVCTGTAWLTTGRLGLGTLPFEAARVAWSIGRA